MIRSAGCLATAWRFSRLPVERSSITSTRLPSRNNLSTRCDPTNPAPPVTIVTGTPPVVPKLLNALLALACGRFRGRAIIWRQGNATAERRRRRLGLGRVNWRIEGHRVRRGIRRGDQRFGYGFRELLSIRRVADETRFLRIG